MGNKVTKTILVSGPWVCPAGVKSIRVKPIYPINGLSESGPLGITPSGSVFTFGFNTSGQLGDGTVADKSFPVQVSGGHRFAQVSKRGFNHVVGVNLNGDAYAWGLNTNGQLGDGSTTPKSTPVLVTGGLKFVRVSAGISYSFGITASGDTYAWGANLGNGQLGDGTTTARSTPVPVLGGLKFVQIECGSQASSHGLTANGDAYGWGYNADGQIGDGTTVKKSSPVLVIGGHKFVQIACGSVSCYGLKSNGDVYAWGGNTYGELGDGTVAPKSSPVAILGGLKFTQISGGAYGFIGIATNGDAYTFGRNSSGQLGDGSTVDKSSPVLVLGGQKFIRVSSGIDGNYGLTRDGIFYVWGENASGQLGDGTLTSRSSPVAVYGGTRFNPLPKSIDGMNAETELAVTPGESYAIALNAGFSFFGIEPVAYGITNGLKISYEQ